MKFLEELSPLEHNYSIHVDETSRTTFKWDVFLGGWGYVTA